MAIPGPALSCSTWVWPHSGDGRTCVLALAEETQDGEAGALSADLGSEQQQEGLMASTPAVSDPDSEISLAGVGEGEAVGTGAPVRKGRQALDTVGEL